MDKKIILLVILFSFQRVSKNLTFSKGDGKNTLFYEKTQILTQKYNTNVFLLTYTSICNVSRLKKGPVIRVSESMLQNLPSFQKVLLLLLEKRLLSLKISHRPVSSQQMPVKKYVSCYVITMM